MSKYGKSDLIVVGKIARLLTEDPNHTLHIKNISEARRGSIDRRLFHGTPSKRGLYNILNHGLVPGEAKAAYMSPLNIALLYSLSPPGSESQLAWKDKGDTRAYVVEILLNLRSQTLGLDEDSLAIGEVPYDDKRRVIPTYQEDEDSWDEYFEEFYPELNKKDRAEFASFVKKNDMDSLRKFAHRMKVLPSSHSDPASAYESGTHHNIVSKQPIGLKGRNRIVGAYVFDVVGYKAVCSSVVYSNGGTIDVGFTSKIATEYIM